MATQAGEFVAQPAGDGAPIGEPGRTAATDECQAAVSLDDLLDAHWRWRQAVKASERANAGTDLGCEDARAEYDRLFEQFELTHDVRIIDQFFGSRVKSAALLTSDGRVRIRYPAEVVARVQPEFEEAVWRTTALAQRSRTLLADEPGAEEPRRREGKPSTGRKPTANERAQLILAEGQHSVLVYLLGVLDSLSSGTPSTNGRRNSDASLRRIHRAIEAANCELDRLDGYTRLVADRAALKHYLFGLPLGVLGLALLAGGLNWLDIANVVEVRMLPLVVPLVAGGVGALISVMTRVSSGDLNVSYTASRSLTFLAGMFRPVIGAVFGVALYVLLQAELLPFVEPPTGEAELFFFAGVGFLAGFSERWAQDQIVQTAAAAERSQSIRAKAPSLAPEASAATRRRASDS